MNIAFEFVVADVFLHACSHLLNILTTSSMVYTLLRGFLAIISYANAGIPAAVANRALMSNEHVTISGNRVNIRDGILWCVFV